MMRTARPVFVVWNAPAPVPSVGVHGQTRVRSVAPWLPAWVSLDFEARRGDSHNESTPDSPPRPEEVDFSRMLHFRLTPAGN